MTDTKDTTKELILSLSQAIKHSDWGSVSLHVKTAKEIKGRLEQQAQPDEELVKEIEQIFLEHNMSIPPSEEIVGKLVKYKPVLSAIGVNMLRSLLQSRQQTKPVVTRGEIDELCETLETIINPEDPTDMDRYMKQYIKDWLKSKGFEEEEKP